MAEKHRCDCGSAYEGGPHEDEWCSNEATHQAEQLLALFACDACIAKYDGYLSIKWVLLPKE